MPEYLTPGVYIEEVDRGARPIEGVGTATAAFVGFAPAGPANRPVLITNWSHYVNTFGRPENRGRRNPHMANAYLSHAVYGYFLNGGGRCYVTRVVATPEGQATPPSILQIPSRTLSGEIAFTLTSKEPLGVAGRYYHNSAVTQSSRVQRVISL